MVRKERQVTRMKSSRHLGCCIPFFVLPYLFILFYSFFPLWPFSGLGSWDREVKSLYFQVYYLST